MNFSRLFLLPLALIALLLTGGTSHAQSTPPPQLAQYQWAFQALPMSPGGRNFAMSWVMAVDSAGYLYGLVQYRGSLTLAGQTIISPDTAQHQFIAKLTPQGQLIWSQPFESPWPYCTYHLQVDRPGNVYVAGLYIDEITIDGRTLRSGGGARDYYVVKLDPNGSLLWADNGGGDGWRFVQDVAVDGTGNLYVTGDYWFTSQINGQIYTPFNNRWGLGNTFCLKYAPTGTMTWVRTGANQDSAAYNRGTTLGTDRRGNVYLQTSYSHTFKWGSRTFQAPQDTLNYVAWMRLNPANGDCVRTFSLPAQSTQTMAVDADGFSYLYGDYKGTIDLHGITLNTQAHWSAYLAKYDPDGVLQWSSPMVSTDPGGSASLVDPRCITLDRRGKAYVSGMFLGHLQMGSVSLDVSGNGFNGFVVAVDQLTGTAQWALRAGGPTIKDFQQVYANDRGEVVLNGYSQQDSVTLGSLLLNSDVSHQFSVRVVQHYNTIRGEVFVDTNHDGRRSAGETPYPHGVVVETLPDHTPHVTQADGRYDAFVDLGGRAVALPYPPAYYTAVATGTTTPSNFSSYGNVDGERNFALQPIPGQQDVQVILTHISPARPGWPVVYDVQYRNTGTVALAAGTVTLTADAHLTYTSASTPPTSTTGTTRTWAYANLLPGEIRHVRVICGLPATTPLGTMISSTATITPLAGDQLPIDNTSTTSRITSGSFDPNDITVNHIQLSTQQVQNGEWLEYTIRFQNHGTDTAFTVIVQDSLSAQLLRLNTFSFLAASHTCGYGINPAGKLIVTFPGIHLPSQATNLIESDGFIRFKVQPINTLVAGDQIPNQARIHFDYNVPMATNTALTVINGVTGLPTAAASGNQAVTVWPNPTSGTLHVEAARTESGTLHLALLDALGRPVLTQTTEATAHTLSRATLDVRGLPTGVYVLRGQGAGQPFTQRVVVR